jgi:hypothetical protein
MIRLITFISLIAYSFVALATPANKECDRYCLASKVYDRSPHLLVLKQQQGLFESWAQQLLASKQGPLYLSYMTAYSQIIESDLNRYWLRYIRRHVPTVQLSFMADSMSESPALVRVNKSLLEASSASKQEVDSYLKKLMWVRIREARRYMLQRFDKAYGLSRMRTLVDQHALSYMALSFEQQVPALSKTADMSSLIKPVSMARQQRDERKVEATENPLLADLQATEVHRDTLSWLTYALRHVSDQELREAVNLYEKAGYQNLLRVTESALELHFDRLMKKNNLSSPES